MRTVRFPPITYINYNPLNIHMDTSGSYKEIISFNLNLFLQSSLHQLVFRWACDDTVTHYIYQGRVGDNTREYRGLKERGLHVVSQYWLHAVCFPAAN